MSFRPRDTYHHGNLREALLSAALALIGERGPGGFSFAEIARAAGVSAAAPYRHFRDRDALIAEVSRAGFDLFADQLAAAYNGGKPSPVAALNACGRAYLQFARSNPAYYAAMFEHGAAPLPDAALIAASDRAFGVLREAAEAVVATAKAPRPPALMVALHIWAFSHGVASLFVGGARGPQRRLPMSAEDLLEAGVLIYLQSLGVEFLQG